MKNAIAHCEAAPNSSSERARVETVCLGARLADPGVGRADDHHLGALAPGATGDRVRVTGAVGVGVMRSTVGAVLVVFFLEATRFVVPLVPFLSAVQGAALREMLIAVALLVILRFYTRGLVPETIRQPPLPEPQPAKA